MLGYPASTIRTLGRWRSLSYQLYLRLQDSDFAGVSNAFGSMPEAQGAIFSPSAFGGISTAAATDVSFENIDTVFGGSRTAIICGCWGKALRRSLRPVLDAELPFCQYASILNWTSIFSNSNQVRASTSSRTLLTIKTH
jgi:hypothetical protein